MNPKQYQLEEFLSTTPNANNSLHCVYFGDINSSLLEIEDNSIDCAITSPPYWNQRDYGFEGQIGNETSIEEYIENLTHSFSLLRSKLKNFGVFYLNIGDKYLAKYGNTSLGLIPYKLVQSLINDGWFHIDTLIWYKPNHMPSSVKNRFTNTYEPVFVLVKNEENYYTSYYHSEEYSNILSIPLQQNTYKHIATFPETLVKTLILISNLPNNATIVDPFAGSGTTSYSVKMLNTEKKTNYSSISIEAKLDFVNILTMRCSIPKSNIKKIKFVSSKDQPKTKDILNSIIFKLKANDKILNFFKKIEFTSNNLIIKSFDLIDYISEINSFDSDELTEKLDQKGIIIIQIPFLHAKFLVDLSKNTKWIIRNIIMRQENNLTYPLILLVRDTKLVRYTFNLDAIREDHIIKVNQNWDKNQFIGMKVIQSKVIYKNSKEGFIEKILSFLPNNFPEFALVRWNDKTVSVEETLNYTETNNYLSFSCPFCQVKLENYFQNRMDIKCKACNKALWENLDSIPNLIIKEREKPSIDKIFSSDSKIKSNNTTIESKSKKNYTGKFSLDDKINRGQSPGARLSVTEQYFFVTRYFDITNGLYAKYLNLLLKKIGLKKTELTKRFPKEYNHTVGHWFRYDMGSSLPKIEDIDLFEHFIEQNINKSYKRLLTKTGIKFQSVLNDNKGKNPGDCFQLSSDEIINYFQKIVS